MLHFERIRTTDTDYAFLENLLHEAFPPEERRDDDAQRDNTDHRPQFHPHVIKDGDEPVGLMTYWKLDDFVYVEHFAVHASKRNGGYGARSMMHCLETAGAPVVLEVEMPGNELSRRRIAFYERCGFRLCLLPYRQPPYRDGDGWLPLYLMYAGIDDISEHFDRITKAIHETVYGVTALSPEK